MQHVFWKKVMAYVLSLVLCVSCTVAFAEDETIELTYWAHSGTKDSVEPLTAAYMAEHPNVKINVSYYATDNIKDALKVAATSDTLPSLWFNWGGNLGGYYVTNGCTYDLTQFAKDHGWAERFNAGALDLCTLDGKLSGYPTSISMLTIYYKKSVFERCGIEVPTTFEELEAACDKLKENGVVPFATAGLYGWHLMRIVEQLVEYYAGPELHNQLQEMTTSWDCEAVTKAFAKYQEWCQKGYFPEGFISNNPDDTLMLLATEQAAMDPEGQWFDNTASNDGLDISEYGWFAFPNGTGRISSFGEMVQFNANLTDAQLEAANDYLCTIYSKESQNGEFNSQLSLTSLADFAFPDTQPHAREVFAYGQSNGTFTITDQAFPSEVADVLFSMQAALSDGSATPAEAAATLEAAVQTYLASR